MNEGGDIPFVSAAECRELDRRAIEEYGIPGLLLMEHASLGAAVRILEVLERPDPTAPVRIVCGPGNNGGDGYAIADSLDFCAGETLPDGWLSSAPEVPDCDDSDEEEYPFYYS